VSADGKKVRNSPDKLGCYLLSKDRTDREYNPAARRRD
jgi:hypothetical protein